MAFSQKKNVKLSLDSGKDSRATFSPAYTNYALGLLVFTNLINFMDRQVISVLLPHIRADMNLSLTETGLLTGFAFAVTYAVFGIPIAWWADRGNRVTIISLALVVWSGMTALCGLAQTYTQLLLARVGVGIGEAGSGPPSQSLISDLFPVEKRAGALGIHSIGSALGIMLGLALGGWLADTIGWRYTLMILAIPGIVLAVILKLTFREPVRGQADGIMISTNNTSMSDVLGYLKSTRTYIHLAMVFAVGSFINYGQIQWLPSYFQYNFGLTTTEIGFFFGIAFGLGVAGGALGGGLLGNHLAAKDKSWLVRLLIISYALMPIITFGVLYTGNPNVAFALLFFTAILAGGGAGPLFATVQSVVPPHMRAMAAAGTGFAASMFGMGLGPFIVGVISDMFTGYSDAEKLRYALYICTSFGFWPVLHLSFALKHFKADLQKMEEQSF